MKREFSFLGVSLALAVAAYGQQAPADTAPAAGRLSREQQLEDVVVAATRADAKTPMAYSAMDKQRIAQRNFGQDVPYLASLMPSVVYTSDAGAGIGYTGIRVRGTDANRINITVNGIPINDAESHGVFWVNMPDLASSLQNIQLQRGVGASTNGAAAFGASLNMQTELLNPKPYAEYSGSVGSFATLKNTVKAGTGLVHNRWAMDIRLSDLRSDGYVDRSAASLQSYYLAAGYYGEKTMLKLVTFAGRELTHQAWNGVPTELLGTQRTNNPCGEYTADDGITKLYYDNQVDSYAQQHYQLMWAQVLSAELKLNLALHYTGGKGYYEDYKEDAKLSRYLIPAFISNGDTMTVSDVVRQKWLNNDFYGATFSLRYERGRINATVGGAASSYRGRHFGYALWIKDYPMNSLPSSDVFYDGYGAKQDYNLFAKANLELLQGLNVYADLQGRYIDYRIDGRDDKQNPLDVKRSYPFFNPKAGALFASNGHETFASFAVGHREPNRDNFTEAGPNEQPTYETLYDYELGYSYSSDGRFSAGLNLYYMDYKNQLILTGKISEIGEMLTTNIADSYRAGVELQAGVSIAHWLRWDGNLTLSQNKIRNFAERDVDVYDANWDWTGTQDNELGETDIAFSPRVMGNSLFELRYRKATLGLHTAYVGRQFLDNTSSRERSIAPYLVNNLQAGYSFTLRGVEISLGAQLNNVLNEQYETNGSVWYTCYVGGERSNDLRYFAQAGRNWMLRVGLKF
ncbi:MAG: TonB-dependent receptor plug domain-containing protein [Prevotellaceae bacterium]|jgi:iron complex outermembrane receptor protein|nr:TonB-dependent receptor plug domain-containing protein [Prevotellaceae bacterium]